MDDDGMEQFSCTATHFACLLMENLCKTFHLLLLLQAPAKQTRYTHVSPNSLDDDDLTWLLCEAAAADLLFAWIILLPLLYVHWLTLALLLPPLFAILYWQNHRSKGRDEQDSFPCWITFPKIAIFAVLKKIYKLYPQVPQQSISEESKL